MLTGRSIKPGAGSISKKQLCHSGDNRELGRVKGAEVWHGVSPPDIGISALHDTMSQRDRH